MLLAVGALRELGKIRGLATTIPTSYILNNVPETTSKLPNLLMMSADFVRKG
jgi:hypothetical protein